MVFYKLSAALLCALAAGAQVPADVRHTNQETGLWKLPTTDEAAERRAILDHAFQLYGGMACADAPAEILHHLCSDQTHETVPHSYNDAYFRGHSNGTSIASNVTDGLTKRGRQCNDGASGCCCVCRPSGISGGRDCARALNACQPVGGSIENSKCNGEPCCLFGVSRNSLQAVTDCFRPYATLCTP